MNKTLNIDGVGKFVLTHKDGSVEVFERHNIITNAGFDFICNAIANATRPNAMSHIAVGTGDEVADATQLELANELTRKQATYTHVSGTKVFTLVANFDEGEATGAITEAGVVSGASGGTLMDRVVFAVINKGADDKLSITFQFTLS